MAALSFGSFVSPWGAVGRARRVLSGPGGNPPFAWCAMLGDLGRVLPNVGTLRPAVHDLAGVGLGVDEEAARTKSIAEALERYSAAVLRRRGIVVSTADGLGGAALDLDTVPRCSASELSNPACPIGLADPSRPIRWVPGLSLTTGRETWLPAVMVFIRIPPADAAERFWIPVSSGTAAHPELAQALVNGICEVIERDAVALIWLQMLSLPRVSVDIRLDAVLARGLCPGTHGHITLLDATTDVGVPVIYAVNEAPPGHSVGTLVACCAHLDPRAAVRSVLLDELLHRQMVTRGGERADGEPDAFTQPIEGTRYMADPARAEAFRFVFGNATRRLSQMACHRQGSPLDDLRFLVDRLASLGMDCFAADLTTDEARQAGLHVVRVLIPGLQPVTFRPRAQYRGHGRLYRAPAAMGQCVRNEGELNGSPQPFG